MIEEIMRFVGTTLGKALFVAVLILLARKWAMGDFDKPVKNLQQLGKEYGITTFLLLVVWWLITPSGSPDDYISFWLIAQIGFVPYILLVGALTIYIMWRLKVTIVIYRK